jgi:hypothetical protein
LEVHGDLVGAGVVLAFDADDGVAEGVVAVLGLDEFLEAAFGVAAVFDDGKAVGEGAVEGEDDALRGGEVAVEVEGADEGFEGVFTRGGAGAPPVDSSLAPRRRQASSSRSRARRARKTPLARAARRRLSWPSRSVG